MADAAVEELIVGKNHNLPVPGCDLGDAFDPRLLRDNNRITEIKHSNCRWLVGQNVGHSGCDIFQRILDPTASC